MVIAVVSLVVMAVGAWLPWFDGRAGGGSGPLGYRVTTVVLGIVAVAMVVLRPGWAWVPGVLLIVVVAMTLHVSEPGWLCASGEGSGDDYTGGCFDDEWTPTVYGYGLGAGGVLIGSVVAFVSRWTERD